MKELLDDYEQTPQKFQGLLSPEQHATMQGYLDLRKQENDSFRHYVMDNPISSMVPDAPFKDTYHELALKQQLLDAANDPSLEWLGVADADTVSKLEGHPEVREGTELWYNQKHPSALQKLLQPLGGEVGYDNLPGQKPLHYETITNDNLGSGVRSDKPRVQVYANLPDKSSEQVASIIQSPLEGKVGEAFYQGQDIGDQLGLQKNPLPGPGMWKANLTPELKELIKTRGFPVMAALLALQQSLMPRQEQD
jgi:hypothetical protein